MIINKLRIEKTEDQTKLVANIDGVAMWYAVPHEYAEYLTETYDPFVLAMLPRAMELHQDMRIEGVMSARLYYNLTFYGMKIISIIIPQCRAIQIKPHELSTQPHETKGEVGLALSCGVDSLSAFYDHTLNPQCPPTHRITYLANAMCGSSSRYSLGKRRAEGVEQFAEKFDLPCLTIESNVHFINNINHVYVHLHRNLSTILALQKLFSRFIYSSSLRYKDCILNERCDDFTTAEPFFTHLVSTETTDFISHGCQYTRVEKTKIMAQIDESTDYLDVCYDRGQSKINCSDCAKCFRTMLTLDILGILSRFEPVFNLNKYRKGRDTYIREDIIRYLDQSNLRREIVSHAKAVGYKPITSRIQKSERVDRIMHRMYERKMDENKRKQIAYPKPENPLHKARGAPLLAPRQRNPIPPPLSRSALAVLKAAGQARKKKK